MKDQIIRDETEPCPYLDGQVARMPLRIPSAPVNRSETDSRLADGQRRAGDFVYKTDCPNCNECVPIRVVIEDFVYSKSNRRVLKKGDSLLEQNFGPLVANPIRVDLFNKHRQLRGLNRERENIDLDDFRWGLVRTCFESFEMTYWIEGKMVVSAICDRGHESLSAVYTYYDPGYSNLSLGTYSILKQIQFCQRENLSYLYLGYFVEDCRAMNYKTRFVPHERLLDGVWQRFDN